MDHYNIAKKLTDRKFHALEKHICTLRQRSQKLVERHLGLLQRQHDLTQQNGGSNVQGSDKIHLNVGGTEMYALRETLTKIKGSRLEALFSGRWEDQLLHDDKGRVFIDMDARYFKKIVEHLELMETNKDGRAEEVPNWPKLPNATEQRVLELYLDLFHLSNSKVKKCNSICLSSNTTIENEPCIKGNNGEGDESFEDLLVVVKKEAHELDTVEKSLDAMELDFKEEEDFVMLFAVPHTQQEPQEEVQQGSHKGSDDDTDDGISFVSMTSDDLASNVSSIYHGSTTNDNAAKSPILHLWIDGEIIAVKRSTLCVHKGSHFAANFNNADWVNKHTLTTKDGTEVVLMGHSNMMLSIINHLRLQSMMIGNDELPRICEEKQVSESVANVISKLFSGLEERFLSSGKSELESQIVTSLSDKNYISTWLEEVNRRSELKLLYRASRDGWSTNSFHSKCDNHQHTLTVVKTVEGYVFGGYSDQTWNCNGGWKSSSSSFLFSLKCHAGLSPTKMKVKSGQERHAVYAHSSHGPTFGDGHHIRIGTSSKKGYTNPNNTYEIPSEASNTFLTGRIGSSQKFDIAEVEVFEV